MNYIMLSFSLLLLLTSSFLTGYNVIYVFRLKKAGSKLGTGVPGYIKKLFGITILLSSGAALISLVVIISSIPPSF